jgi:hypothetical protein
MTGRRGGRVTSATVTSATVTLRAGLVTLIGLIGSVGLGGTARGHNPDTSYARVAIGPDAVVIRLTYDITSLVRMTPGLDADGDRRLAPGELAAGVSAIAAFLRDRVCCEIDAAAVRFPEPEPVAWPPDAGPAIAAADWHAPTALVTFAFRLPTTRRPADVWLRFGFYDDLGLAHAVLGAFEQAGATQELVFTAFEPDYLFETSWAADDARPPSGPTALSAAGPAAGIAADPPAPEPPPPAGRRGSSGSLVSRLVLFFRLGVEHILVGFDHVLFLVALVLASDLRALVRIVTAFTVAHSITLGLATLGWVQPPPRLVESAIAATIVFTALENLWIRSAAGRWRLTFLFGLVHGFGFAGVLRDLGLPRDGFVRALLAFNLGVEAGQLLIVAALALPAALVARSPHARGIRAAASLAIAACGLGWLLDRAFGLWLMPW